MTKHSHGAPGLKGYVEYNDDLPEIIVNGGAAVITVSPVAGRPEMVDIMVGRFAKIQINGMFLAAALRDMLRLEPFETAIPEAD